MEGVTGRTDKAPGSLRAVCKLLKTLIGVVDLLGLGRRPPFCYPSRALFARSEKIAPRNCNVLLRLDLSLASPSSSLSATSCYLEVLHVAMEETDELTRRARESNEAIYC